VEAGMHARSAGGKHHDLNFKALAALEPKFTIIWLTYLKNPYRGCCSAVQGVRVLTWLLVEFSRARLDEKQ